MCRSVGRAREKSFQIGTRVLELPLPSTHWKSAAVDPKPNEKPEDDWQESRSDGCGQSLWAARAERSDVKTRSRPESCCPACCRGRNPSSGKSRVHGQRLTIDDWKSLRDGCSDPDSATPAWGRRKQAWRRPPSRDDGAGAVVLQTVVDRRELQPGPHTGASCCGGS